MIATCPVWAEGDDMAPANLEILLLQPYKTDLHPSHDMMPNGVACGVKISIGNTVPQDIITVGEGESETLSCLDFVEAGLLRGSGRSLGLIYDFESGPNLVFRGAVILSWREDEKSWFRNEDYEGVLTVNSAIDSLDALRSAISMR